MNSPTKRALKLPRCNAARADGSAINEQPNQEGTETLGPNYDAIRHVPINEQPNQEGTETSDDLIRCRPQERPSMNSPTKRALKPGLSAFTNSIAIPSMNSPTKRALKQTQDAMIEIDTNHQ